MIPNIVFVPGGAMIKRTWELQLDALAWATENNLPIKYYTLSANGGEFDLISFMSQDQIIEFKLKFE